MHSPSPIATSPDGAGSRPECVLASPPPSLSGDAAGRERAARVPFRFWRALALGLLLLSLSPAGVLLAQPPPGGGTSQSLAPQSGGGESSFLSQRQQMVQTVRRGCKVSQQSLLAALGRVPRHLFVPEKSRNDAYQERPVALSSGQTLPQACVSAQMISLLELQGTEKVLEIGTGSGYDSALLSQLAATVDTIEIDPDTGHRAERLLRELGYHNVDVHVGDGYRGLPEKAPFDAILITAAPQKVPEPLFDQLKVGGKMVVAVGHSLYQDLQVITKTARGREVRRVNLISLAPMTGEITQQN